MHSPRGFYRNTSIPATSKPFAARYVNIQKRKHRNRSGSVQLTFCWIPLCPFRFDVVLHNPFNQLNYYGFVHVRSFSATGNTTTALWINQHLAEDEANDDVSSVLKLRRVEPDEVAKTVEGRRLRKELAIHTVEEDIGLNSKTLRMGQIRSMAARDEPMPPRRGQSCDAAMAFLRPRGSSFSDGHPDSKISPLDSEISNTTTVNYCFGNDDGISPGDTPTYRQMLPKATEERANTDAAASVLMMLSRS